MSHVTSIKTKDMYPKTTRSFAEIKEEVLGKKGTPARDEYELELSLELASERTRSSLRVRKHR